MKWYEKNFTALFFSSYRAKIFFENFIPTTFLFSLAELFHFLLIYILTVSWENVRVKIQCGTKSQIDIHYSWPLSLRVSAPPSSFSISIHRKSLQVEEKLPKNLQSLRKFTSFQKSTRNREENVNFNLLNELNPFKSWKKMMIVYYGKLGKNRSWI